MRQEGCLTAGPGCWLSHLLALWVYGDPWSPGWVGGAVHRCWTLGALCDGKVWKDRKAAAVSFTPSEHVIMCRALDLLFSLGMRPRRVVPPREDLALLLRVPGCRSTLRTLLPERETLRPHTPGVSLQCPSGSRSLPAGPSFLQSVGPAQS